MAQIVYSVSDRKSLKEFALPPAEATILGGVRWGRFSQPYTPAFWRALWLLTGASFAPARPATAQGIRRETVFCLLGGYGIKAEIAHAYYRKLSAAGLFRDRLRGETAIRRVLMEPAEHSGSVFRYRFPNQKARYLARALEHFAARRVPRNDLFLRDWLLEIPGIGHKTAAWIVRNCLGSDNVAIIDIHLQRAGRLMGLFDARALTAKTYTYFESRFLAFARALQVPASALDLFIWETMRAYPLMGARPI